MRQIVVRAGGLRLSLRLQLAERLRLWRSFIDQLSIPCLRKLSQSRSLWLSRATSQPLIVTAFELFGTTAFQGSVNPGSVVVALEKVF